MPAETDPEFSLIDMPWIPLLGLDGTRQEVSLAEVFAEAPRSRCVAGDIPTQTFAIIRLLLAVLHAATDGPRTERDWETLWSLPDLPVAQIESYLHDFRDRFDLLHNVTPFYQVAGLRTAKNEVNGLERIVADVPNGTPYLTARSGAALERISYADAARWLVHCQAFDPSGIKSGAIGDSRVKGGKGYPIGVGYTGTLGGIFLEGETLRETLLLNLIASDFSEYVRSDPRDAPTWERLPHDAAEEPEVTRGPYGVLSLYTWQSRRIRLVGDGVGISGVLVANGDKISANNLHQFEPLTAWRRSPNQERSLKLPQVYTPRLHQPARALWRGLAALLPSGAPVGGSEGPPTVPPAVMQWAARLANNGLTSLSTRLSARAIGMQYGTQQSVVDQTYDDSVTLGIHLLTSDSALRVVVTDAATDADKAAGAVRTLAGDLARARGGSGDAVESAQQRGLEQAYAELDPEFRRWQSVLSAATDPHDAHAVWQRHAHARLTRLGADLIAQAGPGAVMGRVVKDDYLSSARADVWFRRNLREALPLSASAPAQPDHAPEVPV